MKDVERIVEALLAKAKNCGDGGEAMRFTQAAVNAANAAHTLASVRKYLEE